MYYISKKVVQTNLVLHTKASFTFFSYEILVDSMLATRRIGEQKFSCLQFASSAHNVASEEMETFCIFVKFSIDTNDIVVVFYCLFLQK